MADGRRARDDDPFGGEAILDALSADPRERQARRRPGDPDPEDPRLVRCERMRDHVLGRPSEEDERRARLEEIQTLIAGRHRLERGREEPGGGAPHRPTGRARPTDPDVLDEIAFAEDLHAVTPRVLVTPLLIGLNVGVFAVLVLAFGVPLMMPGAEQLRSWGANFAPDTTNGEWWRLVTSMFLHFGLLHIFFNMWVLKQVGPMVERLLGSTGFLVMYMGSGVVGSLVSTWSNPDVVSAGASGAVFGVIGALVGVLVLGHGIIPRATLARLRRSVFTFVLLNVYLGFSVPGIDIAAHLGGLAAGLMCGLVMTRPDMLVSPHGRSGRDLTALALCGLAVLWLLVAVPEVEGGATKAYLDASGVDREVAAEAARAIVMHNRGELDEAALADRLDPLVARLEDALATLRADAADAPPDGRLEALRELLDARLEAYHALGRYLRTGHEDWLEQYNRQERFIESREGRLR